jgi:hypothetical protein
MNASGAILSLNAKSRTSEIPNLPKQSLKYVIVKTADTQIEPSNK